jgi:hypothetical protein
MFLSFDYGANAAAQHRFCIHLFSVFPMQVTTTTPQTLRELLAGGSDTTKVLLVVCNTMPKASFL